MKPKFCKVCTCRSDPQEPLEKVIDPIEETSDFAIRVHNEILFGLDG